MKLQEALAYRAKIENAAAFQDDENALESIELFPKWVVGIDVKTGERYQHQALLWRVVQDHTTQADWEPQNTPALFVQVTLDEWPEWVRPAGAHDAYNTGDKVTYNGQHYVSTIDGNVYSPEEFPAGWNLVE